MSRPPVFTRRCCKLVSDQVATRTGSAPVIARVARELGAVIDEAMSDEIRVTVIATGFGDLDRGSARYSPSGAPVTTPIAAASTRPVDPMEVKPAQAGQVRMFPGNKPVRRMGMVVDDSTLDIPAFRRRGEDAGLMEGEKLEPNSLLDGDDKLDIPTFLRKHLD